MTSAESPIDPDILSASRRRLALDTVGIALSVGGFGLVYGLAARAAGLSLIDVAAMSTIVFAGGSQFAALVYISIGAPWISIIVVAALINARHFLYGAALAPYFGELSLRARAAMAHVLTDEAFALSTAHFVRLGRADVPGYWFAAIVSTFIPWVSMSILGAALAGGLAQPEVLGLDIIFPAAMAGLAAGLVTGRREVAAVVAGVIVGVIVGLFVDRAVGIVAGGIVGPLVGLLVPVDEQTKEGAT